ncbi:MAG: hypothetical protein JO342_00875 [Solirubrobacterales bacterium]|nr:hypothetical protein [Solirubrobacterales bacterium]
MLEFFVDTREPQFWKEAVESDAPSEIDRLVNARQDFSIDVKLAWKGIEEFREKYEDLSETPKFPELVPEGVGPRLSGLAMGMLDRLSTGSHDR